MSLPSARVIGDAEWMNLEDSTISRRTMVWRFGFGTSMPTVASTGDALDAHRLDLEAERKVVLEGDDLGVLEPSRGAELVGRDHRAR